MKKEFRRVVLEGKLDQDTDFTYCVDTYQLPVELAVFVGREVRITIEDIEKVTDDEA